MNSGQPVPRVAIDLSRGWDFVRGRVARGWLGGAGSGAERVDLPHCWNARDTFEPGAVYYQGDGAYRLAFDFSIPDAQAYAWQLRSEGFYGTGDVWLNGRKLARVEGQYLGFHVALAEAPHAGRNTIGIRLENRYHRNVLPGNRMPDFLLYGGLAGRVWLEGLPRAHFVERETWVYCGVVTSAAAEVCIPFALGGDLAAGRLAVRWCIRDSEGRVVASTALSASAASGVARLTVPAPRLWSVEQPALYEAEGELRDGEAIVDRARMRFGCRTAEFRAGAGFFLNGARCELHGCNRHESMPGFGNAMPEELHRADARLLKQHGCNFVRLSHYPQHPAFLNACDEFGLLVYAEIATWKIVRGGGWLRAAERQMRGMIARDRHHPSVILWGMGNEGRDRRAYARLREVAAAMDPTRPTIYAENHLYRARRQRTLGIPDVWGCNYELEVIEEGARAAQLGNVVVSECANYPPAVRGNLLEEAEQVALIARDLATFRQKPFVAGFALWCWADYATLRKQRFVRNCGIVDAWRQPKMAAELMKAMFRLEPVVQVSGDWSTAGPPVRAVHVFSNCRRVTLSLEGRVVRTLEGGPAWRVDVAFAAAPLQVRGERDGQVAAATLAPYGAAHRLAIGMDAFAGDSAASGLLVAQVRVLDAVGVPVTNWSGWVKVAVTGESRLIAHTPDDRITVAGGVGRIFVMRTNPAAAVEIRAEADGLAGAAWQYSATPPAK